MTINRRTEYQIETSILMDNEGKKVYKRALNEQARSHVNRMYEYYCNSGQKEKLCPLHLVKDGEVYFDFIQGISMNEQMLECLRRGEKAEFQVLLQEYRKFIEDNCVLCESPSAEDPACNDVFGISTWNFPGSYGRHLNIDLCFDNVMIRNQQKVIIDYEWVFDMVLPVNFVVYRGIWALYARNAECFWNMYTWQELYESMGMTESEVAVYEKMNECFNEYVYGGENSYNHLLPQYAKKTLEMREDLESQGFWLQVYAEREQGYSEEESCKIELFDQQVKQELDVSAFAGATALRVDPCHIPCVCRDMKVELTDTLGKHYELQPDLSNGYATEQGMIVYTDSDPQMIYHKIWQGEPEKLHISYYMQCELQGEELERYQCMVEDAAKTREGYLWYKNQTEELQKKKQKLKQLLPDQMKSRFTHKH